ncbi:glycerophosphoryl diester phosphodiesterase [Clostridium algifaecis]|uniref:Glycerophosphoryl diester phosphodiesterase n=1 Tax=Clostridium algifaecis TaxID=1472040 RepID=A0ABS4KPH8_9CLOT|nr:glycerophosphodiester phosphodiesterase [Clostridium algifaecis]MBP2031945.1 glycerophosphoryl diester phosphodiesterase [Clostridium algifaecis]
MTKSLNIAHRGFSGKYPENTMIAFKKAVEIGSDGIETDVHMTKDGAIVICHDEKLDRTTNGQGFIKDFTYDEIKKLDAGLKFGERFKGEAIPDIDEFLDYVKDKNILVNIELKNDMIHYKNLEEKVVEKIYEYGMKDKVILSSFNHYAMVKVKDIDISIKTGLLYEAVLYKAEEYAKMVGSDALHPYFPAVMNKTVVDNIKKQGIAINTYTVNEEKDMEKLIQLGIDGIITNYPDVLGKLVR